MNLREAAEKALESLEIDDSELWPCDKRTAAIDALRAALEEKCEWKSDGVQWWKTGCGEVAMSDGDPIGLDYCPYCGSPVELKDDPT